MYVVKFRISNEIFSLKRNKYLLYFCKSKYLCKNVKKTITAIQIFIDIAQIRIADFKFLLSIFVNIRMCLENA